MRNFDTAHSLYMESLALARELGARGVIEETLNVLGKVARDRGDNDAAIAFHEERLQIARDVGSELGVAESLYDLGLLARDRGEHGRARTLWSESLEILRRLGDPQDIADCLEAFASLAAHSLAGQPDHGDPGDPNSRPMGDGRDTAERAARLYGAAAALRDQASASLAPRHGLQHQRHVAAVRARLGEAAFAAAWTEGRAMTQDQASCLALKNTDDSSRTRSA
jgi:tetratricopeptide (TPR) repeat protein